MGCKLNSLNIIRIFLVAFFFFALSATTAECQAQKNGGKLSDLDFIVGHWKAKTTDRTVEGQWMPQDGDNMLGFMRMMNGSKAAMYELLALRTERTRAGIAGKAF